MERIMLGNKCFKKTVPLLSASISCCLLNPDSQNLLLFPPRDRNTHSQGETGKLCVIDPLFTTKRYAPEAIMFININTRTPLQVSGKVKSQNELALTSWLFS